LYLRFFLFAIAAAFVLGITGIEAQQAFADVIDFESGFVDLQPVGVVVTATNTVTFGVVTTVPCTNPTTGFIAEAGLPQTAYVPTDDIPLAASGGSFFLTDETAGPSATLNYCISFATPVINLSLDLYDYRTDGGASVGSNATLTVFDAGSSPVGSVKFEIPPREPDPNLATLSIPSPTGLISTAELSFNKTNKGTGIDNIKFTTTVLSPKLFSSGLDAGGGALPLGDPDPHYVVIENSFLPAVVMNPIPGVYFPNDANSQWIWQNADGLPINVVRTFSTTFDLGGLDPSTAQIDMLVGTDNQLLDIKINGISTGQQLLGVVLGNFNVLHPFSIDSGFQPGINTLEFIVEDNGVISGFRVEITSFTDGGEEPEPTSTRGGGDHEPPTIGMNYAGTNQIVTNGMCIDGQCRTVTQPFHEEMKLIQMLTSPHTISNTIFCNEGVQECNYVGVAFTTKDFDYNDPVMKVEAKKTNGEWAISWYDPQDFIQDPDDAIPGEITFSAQIIGDNFLVTSFTINFKNKDTGELVIGIQVRDVELGVRTFWFNEGVEFKDSDAYPSIETEFEKPLDVEPLCLNEDPTYRYSCAFAKKVQLEIERAEKLLAE